MKLSAGGKILAVLAGLGIIAWALDRYVGFDRVVERFGLAPPQTGRLSTADFPAGAAAPVGDLAALPSRPVRIVGRPRGALLPLYAAVGGARTSRDAPLFRGYGLEAEFVAAADPDAVRAALEAGGERGGADLAALSVDALAALRPLPPDAAPRTVALLGKSRGHDALATGAGPHAVAGLAGRAVAAAPGTCARYFALWRLAQAGLTERSVRWVAVATESAAAQALGEGRAEVAAGYAGELALAAQRRGGKMLASTADAPHLCATVLAGRRDFVLRYPEAVRRILRAFFDAVEAAAKAPPPWLSLLPQVAPGLGDPHGALAADPPSSLADNLAFFGIAGDAPVRYDELYASAASLWAKLGERVDAPAAAETRDLEALRAVARAGDERAPADRR